MRTKPLIIKDIILETTDERSINYKWEKNSDKLNSISVISGENLPKEIKGYKLIGRNSGKDNVFLKNPFSENEFIEISRAEQHIFLSKVAIYSEILCDLGATVFSIEAEFLEEKKIEIGADGAIEFKVVKLTTEMKNEILEKLKTVIGIGDKFVKTKNFDALKSYENAKLLFEKYPLEKEQQLKSLINNRNPNKGAIQTHQTVNMSFNHEFNEMIECAANITVMPGVFSLSAGFKTSTQSIKIVNIKYIIEFDD